LTINLCGDDKGKAAGCVNNNYTIISGNLTTSSFTQNASAGTNYWMTCAISGNGQYQIAWYNNILSSGSATSGSVYVSNNYGVTWTSALSQTFSAGYGGAPTSYVSYSGQYQIIGIRTYIFYSNNYGSTWNTVTSVNGGAYCSPSSIYISNGLVFFTNSGGNGIIMKSTDYGSTSASTGVSVGYSLGVSSNGQYLLAGSFSSGQGNMYVSSNSGSTWTATGIWGGNVAVSGNGQYMVGINSLNGNNSSSIYVSNNYGVSGSWTTVTLAVNQIAISYTGQFMIGCNNGGYIYFSSNYGLNWAAVTSTGQVWTSIAISGDGSTFTGIINGGYIYNATLSNIGYNYVSPLSTSIYKIGSASLVYLLQVLNIVK